MKPIYIPSKGRAGIAATPALLDAESIPYHIVVEPQELNAYEAAYPNRCLVMDRNDQGIAYARSWIKRHAGSWHWQIDDDLRAIKYRGEHIVKTSTREGLEFGEELAGRYRNVGILGLAHVAWANGRRGPFSVNRVAYTCVLVNGELDVWWRPEPIEDTDYSLQVLSYQERTWCTIVVHDYVCDVPIIMTQAGGNTPDHGSDVRRQRIEALQRLWPGAFEAHEVKGVWRMKPSRVWGTFTQRLVPVQDVPVEGWL